ncbi:MAG: hypothetical protein JNL11_11480 [Bdellovibrionaceae bacterium]|nr:hypothetical protein [Pseudobdellovibrionaceae bacterium]
MKFFFIITILTFFTKTFAGQEVGNGGGFCLLVDNSYAMYDSIVTINATFGENRQSMPYAQHLQLIRTQLHRLKEPKLKEFDLFISTLFSQKTGSFYQWFARTNLTLMWEPGLEPILPKQCRTRKQAVYYFIRPPNFGNTVDIIYDPTLLAQIAKQPNGGLQISYLLIHEWLWLFFSRTTYVNMATFNRLLQSEKLKTITVQDYTKIRAQLFPPETPRMSR